MVESTDKTFTNLVRLATFSQPNLFDEVNSIEVFGYLRDFDYVPLDFRFKISVKKNYKSNKSRSWIINPYVKPPKSLSNFRLVFNWFQEGFIELDKPQFSFYFVEPSSFEIIDSYISFDAIKQEYKLWKEKHDKA